MAEDPLVTIRVINVPAYTNAADFANWFIFAEGFEAATLVPTRGPQESQLGWARFASVECADFAMRHLDGRMLNDMEGTVLRAEWAKSNYKPSHQGKDQQGAYQHQQASFPPAPFVMPPTPPPPPVRQHTPPAHGGYNRPPPARGNSAPPMLAHCSTIFIGGLREENSEEELAGVLQATFPGFERLKYQPASNCRPGTAWAKFANQQEATEALNLILEGVALPSTPEVVLRGEVAKNDLDKTSSTSSYGAEAFGGKGGGYGAEQPRQQWAPWTSSQHGPAHSQRYGGGGANNSGNDTVFVGNMAPNTTEADLEFVVGPMPGYARMKFTGEGTYKPVAFVQFASADFAAAAVRALQGGALACAPDQALNVDVAKNSLGKRHRSG